MRSPPNPGNRPQKTPPGAFNRFARQAVLGACLALVASQMARAAETVIPVTPPGSTDVDQAFLPPSGLYGGAVVIPFNQDYHAYDSAGNRAPTSKQSSGYNGSYSALTAAEARKASGWMTASTD